MSTTIAQTQQGSQLGQSQSITSVGNADPVVAGFYSVLFRYQLPTTAMLGYPLQWTGTVAGAAPGDVFVIITISDPDLVSAIVNDFPALNLIPPPVTTIVTGTAPYVELARTTVTANGTYTFDLDLSLLTPIMHSSSPPVNPYANPTTGQGTWNGSLLLWLYTTNSGGAATWSPVSLTAGVYLVRSNFDTGRSQAPEGSRMDRCPVTGLAISRQRMVLDGYRGIYVHPSAWDPAEPEPLVWGEYPDPNEGGGT